LTSAHLTGYAADIIPSNGQMKIFQVWITDEIENYNFDECFIEKSRTSQWVHIALYSIKGLQRRKKGNLYV
jgi:hypothetical protein